MEFREIKDDYKITDVRNALTEKGYRMISNTPITNSGIIKAYEFWFNPKADVTIGLEIWKNDSVIILKQISINEI